MIRIEKSQLKEVTETLTRQGFKPKCLRVDWSTGYFITYSNTSDERVNLHSCAKTVTAIAVGFCVLENLLDLNDCIVSFFPEYRQGSFRGTENITIKHLLQMTSGKHLRSLLNDSGNQRWNDDWLAWFFESQLNGSPGSQFYYSGHCTYVLGRIIEKITGEKVNQFLLTKLWEPLEIPLPYWGDRPTAHTICAGNLFLSCEELSKIGLTLLNFGHFKGKQIIDKAYVEKMIHDTVPSCDPFFNDIEGAAGYGYSIWKNTKPKVFRLWGLEEITALSIIAITFALL